MRPPGVGKLLLIFTHMYALQDNSCDHPPQFNGPSPQLRSPPSTVSYAVTVSISDTSPSQISQEAFDKVTQENTHLSRCVNTLVAQVSTLVQKSKYTFVEPIAHSTSPSSPPANTTLNPQTNVAPTPSVSSLPPEQIQAIVNQAAAAVLSAIESSRKHQPKRTTKVLESSTSRPNAMLQPKMTSTNTTPSIQTYLPTCMTTPTNPLPLHSPPTCSLVLLHQKINQTTSFAFFVATQMASISALKGATSLMIAIKSIDFKQILCAFTNTIWIPTIIQLKTSSTRPHNASLIIPYLPLPAVPSQLPLHLNQVAL